MKTLILLVILLSGFGCTGLQPMGPLAKSKAKPPVEAPVDPDIPPPPAESASASAKLVHPAVMIEAGDVNAGNASESIRKLTNEFNYDWKTLPPPSRTAEISQYKNGVKVR